MDAVPKCPEHGDYFVVLLDPEDAEERPTSPEMTHRCAACGKQLAGSTPCV